MTKYAKRDDCDLQHESIDKRLSNIENIQKAQGDDITYIRGKIDGATEAKRDKITPDVCYII